jgi:hypothetical protein
MKKNKSIWCCDFREHSPERECSLRADQVIILCRLLQDYIQIGFCLLFLSSDDFQNVSKSIDKYLHVFSVITIIIQRSTIVLRVPKYRTYYHFRSAKRINRCDCTLQTDGICNIAMRFSFTVARNQKKFNFYRHLLRVFSLSAVIGYLLPKHNIKRALSALTMGYYLLIYDLL